MTRTVLRLQAATSKHTKSEHVGFTMSKKFMSLKTIKIFTGVFTTQIQQRKRT